MHKWIENIPSDKYKAQSQIWDIERVEDKYMLFAAGFSMAVWDGVRWNSYKSDDNTLIRSLCYDKNSNLVYCAGNDFIGYWIEDNFGDFHFKKIEYNCQDAIFWNIIAEEEFVYFQSNHSILILDKIKNSISKIEAENIQFIYSLNNEVFAQIDYQIARIEKNNIINIGLDIEDKIINLFHNGENLLLVLENKGLFIYQNGVLSELNRETNNKLLSLQIFCAERYDNNSFFVGTVLNGAYLINNEGEIIESISEESGLRNSTVLSIGFDHFDNRWLGLDGGISFVKEGNKETYFNSHRKNIGLVYSSLLLGDKLYLGTNKGLYISENGQEPQFIPKSIGQVWSIVKIGNDIIVNHNKGLFILDNNNKFSKIHHTVWHLRKWYGRDNLYCFGDKEGIALLNITNDGKLNINTRIEGYNKRYPSAWADKFGYLWVREENGEVVRLTLDRDLKKVISTKRFTVGDGGWIRVSYIDGELIFNSYNKLYNYDPVSDMIIENDYYTNLNKSMSNPQGTICQFNDLLFITGDNSVTLAKRVGGKVNMVRQIFNNLNGKMTPPGYRYFEQINDSLVMLGFNNGVAFYNIKNNEEYEKRYNIKLIKASYTLNGENVKVDLSKFDNYIKIPSKAINLELSLTGVPHTYQLDYFFDIDSIPHAILAGEKINISSLKSGKHILNVGNSSSNIDSKTITIEVEKRFIDTYWFYIIIFLSAISSILLFRILYNKRLLKIENTILKSQEERFRLEKIRHEKTILEIGIKERDKKLTTLAMNNINVNNMLSELQKEINKIDLEDSIDAKKRIKKLLRHIAMMKQNEDNWLIFEKHFNNVYDGFFDKLKSKYEKLTNNDLKICAYIKLGMSSKEISNLMNIEVSSVESARYRLRKNMKLTNEESLSDIISNV